jgi:hypothetical protein
MAKVTFSPHEHSSINGWNLSVVSICDMASQHSATKWFKTTTAAAKHDLIISGAAAGILTLCEPNKIRTLGLLSLSQAFLAKCLAQGSHNLNQMAGVYVNRKTWHHGKGNCSRVWF